MIVAFILSSCSFSPPPLFLVARMCLDVKPFSLSNMYAVVVCLEDLAITQVCLADPERVFFFFRIFLTPNLTSCIEQMLNTPLHVFAIIVNGFRRILLLYLKNNSAHVLSRAYDNHRQSKQNSQINFM